MRRPEEVMVFVRRGEEVLVLHRSPAYESYWHVVSGGVEESESFAAAAAREVAEETGLVVEVRPLERRFTYPLQDESEVVRARFAPEVEEVLVETFLVEAPEGWEPALNDEHDGYRWCGIGAAATLLFWPEPRALVRELPPAEVRAHASGESM